MRKLKDRANNGIMDMVKPRVLKMREQRTSHSAILVKIRRAIIHETDERGALTLPPDCDLVFLPLSFAPPASLDLAWV